MKQLSHMGKSYELDDQGCLLNPDDWDENFAEGMARECEIPVLCNEHWDVIHYLRSMYESGEPCPTIFATCKATGLLPQEMKKLFPSGYHRGACRVAGVLYRINPKAYGSHIKKSMADLRSMANDKVYCTDVRGFLIDPDTWDEDFAVHRAIEMHIPGGQMTNEHWRILYYLRDVYQLEHRIPNIYETCESCDLDLDTFEQLFPDGYHRGAIKLAGLRFVK